MNRLASDDFRARLEFERFVQENSSFVELTGSFNTMAQQLENTEMLRGGFVNNFSHEFPPIVSIAGLAKLLKKGNQTTCCRRHVAKYAMPYDIEFKEDMPKTLVGKVACRVLEEKS